MDAGRDQTERRTEGGYACSRRSCLTASLSALAALLAACGGVPATTTPPPAPTPSSTAAQGGTPRAASTKTPPPGQPPGTPPATARLGDGVWQYAGAMRDARSGHTATRLRDGRVLVAGGGPEQNRPLATTELYEPATSSWTSAVPMDTPRSLHAATLLPDGQVLVTGGFGTNSVATLATAERYDPATGRWTPARSMTNARAYHTATPLPSGLVLVVGGISNGERNRATADLYDPATNGWRPTSGPRMPRRGHTATLLPSGQVLVVGGGIGQDQGDLDLRAAERYDPATESWTPAASLADGRMWHAATALPDGQVLVVGGGAGNARSGQTVATAERYDPVADRWSPAGRLSVARAGLTAELQPGGPILAAGGIGNTRMGYPLDAVDRYDPATGDWFPAPPLASSRSEHTATALTSGDVLIVGGAEAVAGFGGKPIATSELYTARPPAQRPPIPTPLPVPSPWHPAGVLTTARKRHATVTLGDGRVLVIGGRGPDGPLASVERYDPATGRWTTVAPLATPRVDHTATVLHNGRVLVVGGAATAGDGGWLATTELYDPTTERWTPGPPLATARAGHTATRISDSAVNPNPPRARWVDGEVLVVGGVNGTGALTTAERYDPVKDTWTPAGTLSTVREGHSATPLVNGQVLVAGGAAGGADAPALATAERYDPQTDEWRPAAPMAIARAGHAAVEMNFGQVVVIGGSGRGEGGGDLLASVEGYEFASDRWYPLPPLAVARYRPVVASLSGSAFLITGAARAARPDAPPERYDGPSARWLPVGAPHTPRAGHTVTILRPTPTPAESRALIVGGRDDDGALLDTAELYIDTPPPYKPPTGPRPGPATPIANPQARQPPKR